MSGFATIGMMIAVLALTLLGVRLYEAYQDYKTDKRLEAANKRFLQFSRSLDIVEDPVDWAFNQTTAGNLNWRYKSDGLSPVARWRLGSVDVEINLHYLKDPKNLTAGYGIRFDGARGGLFDQLDEHYWDDYVECEDLGYFEGNIKVKKLFELVQSRMDPRPQ